jgi:excisionase family DNA binding protein
MGAGLKERMALGVQGAVVRRVVDVGLDEFVGVNQVAEYMAVAPSTVRGLFRSGAIRAINVGKGRQVWRARRRWVDEALDEMAGE